MSRRVILLGLMILLAGVAELAPSGAIAAGFSAPVRLPTKSEGWEFAVNDRGEAVGVRGSEAGAMVVQLARSGRISHSWLVSAPAHVGSVAAQVVLGEQGQVAVGVSYGDGQLEPSQEYHGGPGCCDHIAIASWQLGEPPPVAQPVSPAVSSATGLSDQPGALEMVIGRSTLTAVWIRGGGGEEGSEAQIEEAFGRVGEPLHIAKLLTVPSGVSYLDLHLAPDGQPIASWVDDGDIIRTTTGLSTGALSPPVHFQGIPKLSYGIGFTHDDEGDTVFAYVSGPETISAPHTLMMMASSNGGRFTRPHSIAAIPPHTSEVSVYAGGRRSVLAIWTYVSENTLREHFYAQRGSVFGGFGRRAQVDETEFPDDEATGFIDSRGRSVIIHRGPVPHHPKAFELDAFTAPPHGPFRHTHRIAPSVRDCGLNLEEELDVQPIATSLNGQAVFYVTCGEGSHQEGSQYLIRYTP
jgi:hypothetical protein